ncbi:MAG: DUF1638 domain-containing protein [Actinobacteria bacterium]|uniref:Unannotated protein n=1 Tax=freshwater metagenome TaxID=449393 RepID=A0A6J7VVL7_9ZZZZ|nr:DUF1638 domain-containing protein [Actinomycetota bacterium]
MSIGIVACGALATHIGEIAGDSDLDITIYPLPPLLHNRPERIAEEVDALLSEIKDKHSRCAVAYADCGTYGALDIVIERHGVRRLGGNHCYDIFAGESEIEKLMAEDAGTYFLTDFLVKSFHRSVIVELGLDKYPHLRDDYFRNYTRVVWLAQRPTAELDQAALDAAMEIGLPLEKQIVGYRGLRKELEVLISQ